MLITIGKAVNANAKPHTPSARIRAWPLNADGDSYWWPNLCRDGESLHIVAMRCTGKVIGLCILALLALGCAEDSMVEEPPRNLSYSPIEPFVIPLDLPVEDSSIGGLIVADVDNDGHKDVLVTKSGHIAVYTVQGRKLWTKRVDIQVTGQSEKQGLPGWHGPGVQVADVDGDQIPDVLFLTKHNGLQIANGPDGRIKRTIKIESPPGTERWEHLVVANFRGAGDLDLLLQTTNAEGYRQGRYLAAYALEDLLHKSKPKAMWARDDFLANAHNGARVADLDGDGKDEVLGGTIVGHNGKILYRAPLRGHIDALMVGDVRPDIPGLEVLALEEGGRQRLFPNSNGVFIAANRMVSAILGAGNRIFLYNQKGLIWETHYKQQEPQNAAVGDFDPSRPGFEVWCRSRYEKRQRPFVFDARGHAVGTYQMDNVAPDNWTAKGVEVIFVIDWTGGDRQLAVAKERHRSGDVAIFDPISGKFLHRFKESADRLYVADIVGDWREEIIVLNGNEVHIYQNNEANPHPDRSRLWAQQHYRRSKMTWNYYSP